MRLITAAVNIRKSTQRLYLQRKNNGGGAGWGRKRARHCVVVFNNYWVVYLLSLGSRLWLFDGTGAPIAAPAVGSPPKDKAWTMRGSALLPSRNSSSVSLSSWFLSIWSKILSTLFCGVFSSSAFGCWPYTNRRRISMIVNVARFYCKLPAFKLSQME